MYVIFGGVGTLSAVWSPASGRVTGGSPVISSGVLIRKYSLVNFSKLKVPGYVPPSERGTEVMHRGGIALIVRRNQAKDG